MRKPFRSAALVFAFLHAAPTAFAATTVQHVQDGGEDFIVTCNPGPITQDYVANTAAGVAPGSAYTRARGAYKGTIRLMSEGRKRVKQYILAHHGIAAVVRVRFGIADWSDLLFTDKAVILVHTSTADAGIFTDSDIYRLAYDPVHGADKVPVKADADALQMLDLGLAAYQPLTGQCASGQ